MLKYLLILKLGHDLLRRLNQICISKQYTSIVEKKIRLFIMYMNKKKTKERNGKKLAIAQTVSRFQITTVHLF